MSITYSSGASFTPRCINLLLQRPLFLSDASLWWLTHKCPGIVEVHFRSCSSHTWFCWLLAQPRCIARLLQRPDLGPLLSWSLATIVMDLAYGVYWVARTHKITIWKTLIIAARCNNLGLCSLQPVHCYWTWPLLISGHVHSTFSCDRAVVCVGMCWP